MQLRTIALTCSLVGVLYSNVTLALGLGEITLKSQFNQPLHAEIRLLKVNDLSRDEVLVELASREDFKRTGVERLFFLTGMRFEVRLDNPSRPHIRVTTSKPVTEPYLDFLLQVQWPSGRLLREYTLLMDLPTFNGTPSAVTVTAPTFNNANNSELSSTSTSQPTARNSFQSAGTGSSSRLQSEPEVLSTVDRYRVQSGDTLSRIAKQVRPDTSVSINQTMLAIQQANPNAFIGGNINRLRSGRVLRVPSSEEIANIGFDQAAVGVRQQTQEWLSTQRQTNQGPVLTTTGLGSSFDSPVVSGPEGRLILGSASANQGGDVQASGASGEGSSLQKELEASQEELDRSRRENNQLQSRISDLEAQVETMERLIAITNNQLAELQKASELGQTDSNTDTSTLLPAETLDISEPLPAEGDALSESVAPLNEGSTFAGDSDLTATDLKPEPLDGLASSQDPLSATPLIEGAGIDEGQGIEDEGSPTDETALAEEKTTAIEAPVASSGIMGFIQRNVLILGGSLIALLLAIFTLWRLRERPEDTDFDDFDMEAVDEFVNTDDAAAFSASIQDEDNNIVIEKIEEVDESVQAQTEDVVGEADIYIGLGQEEKAIELLQKEIHQNPDNADARLGLLKIYSSMQNATAFDEQYAQLLPLGNTYVNDQAAALRKDIQGIESFDTDQYSLGEWNEGAEANVTDELNEALKEEPKLDLDVVDELDDELLKDESDLKLDFDIADELNDEALNDEVLEGEPVLDLSVGDELGELLKEEPEHNLSTTSGLDQESNADLDLDLADLDLDAESETHESETHESDTLSSLGSLSESSSSEQSLEAVEQNSDFDNEVNLDFGDLSLDLDELDDFDESSTAEEKSSDQEPELALDEFELDDDLKLDLDSEFSPELELGDEGLEADAKDLTLDADSTSESAGLDSLADLDGSDASGAIADELGGEVPDLDGGPAEVLGDLDADTNMESADFALDLPPPNDIDMAGLDEEIDAMTAELDEPLLSNDSLDEETSGLGDEDILSAGINSVTDDSSEAIDTTLESLDDVNSELSIDTDNGNDTELDVVSPSLDEQDSTLSSFDDGKLNELEINNVIDNGNRDSDNEEDLSEVIITEDDDLTFLEESDEISTKLDLAKAYLDMDDSDGAKDMLTEVLDEGNPDQKEIAQKLMRQVNDGGVSASANDDISVNANGALDAGNGTDTSHSLEGVDSTLSADKEESLATEKSPNAEIEDSSGAGKVDALEADNTVASDKSEQSTVAGSDEFVITHDDDLNFLEESDEVSTKLDLAKAYLDMGDREGAEDILDEVMEEGNLQQKDEAQALISQI